LQILPLYHFAPWLLIKCPSTCYPGCHIPLHQRSSIAHISVPFSPSHSSSFDLAVSLASPGSLPTSASLEPFLAPFLFHKSREQTRRLRHLHQKQKKKIIPASTNPSPVEVNYAITGLEKPTTPWRPLTRD